MATKKKQTLFRSIDVAHILDISPDDVLNLRRRGLLKGVRYKAKGWRFREADVMVYKKKMGD